MQPAGGWVLVGTLVLATAAGLVLRARSGRVRRGGATGGWALVGGDPEAGDRVLLLQLSSTVCTPCRRTAELLSDLRTPTVVAFNRAGAELLRVSGVPRTADLTAALAPHLT